MKKHKKIIIAIISILVTIFANLVEANSVFTILLAILIYNILYGALEIKNKRMSICCGILACLFSSFQIVGKSLDNFKSLIGIFENGHTFFLSVFKWLSYSIIFYAVLMIIMSKIDKFKIKHKGAEWFTGNKKSFLISWAIIFLAWIPYFLNYYPGLVTPDSLWQISQTLGLEGFTNMHPIFHTFIIAIPMNIGKWLGSYNLGVALYSLMQMLILSAIFAFSIYYMAKKKVDVRVRALSLIFYAFYQINALYSMTMWKDILFSALMLLNTICLVEITDKESQFLESKLKIFLFILCIILTILLRNNGIHAMVITIPFLFVFARKYYKKLIVITCIVLGFYMIWKGPIFSILNIEEGASREALSIPLQQFARISRDRKDSLTEEEKEQIHKFLPVDNIADLYMPVLSDPVKINLDEDAFKNDKIGFLKLYAGLAIKHPIVTIESFLCNNYGYWYPGAVNTIACRGITSTSTRESIKSIYLESKPIIKINLLEKFDSLIENCQIPVISMIYSVGFAFWVLLTLLTYSIYKKKYNLIMIYIPVLALWLTCIASPVFCEYRYLYAMFICIPIYIGTVLKLKSKEK